MNEALLSFFARAQVLFSQMEAERDLMDQRIKEMQNLEIMRMDTDKFIKWTEDLSARSRREMGPWLKEYRKKLRAKICAESNAIQARYGKPPMKRCM